MLMQKERELKEGVRESRDKVCLVSCVKKNTNLFHLVNIKINKYFCQLNLP